MLMISAPLPLCSRSLTDTGAHACVGNGQLEDVLGADADQVVHDGGDVTLLHHRADGNPTLLLERVDGRRPLARRDTRRRLEAGARDVVLAQDVFARRCESSLSVDG